MAVTPGQFAETWIPVIYEFFEIGYNTIPDVRSQIYNVSQSDLREQKYLGIGGISHDPMRQYGETGIIPELDMSKGFETVLTAKTFPGRITVNMDDIEDDQYGVVGQQAQRLGRAYANMVQDDAASLFNNAFSTSFNQADGKPLCADSHPSNIDDDSNAGDNKDTSELSEGTLAGAYAKMLGFKDDVGNKIGVNPDTLLVPETRRYNAIKAVQSEYTGYTGASGNYFGNNAVNPMGPTHTGLNIIIWNRLTDGNNWFLIDSSLAKMHAHWNVRKAVSVSVRDISVQHVQFEIRARYSFGSSDWRWVFGAQV